jgi:hypothetical protein
MAMLRLTAHHLCGQRTLTTPGTHVLEVILRPDLSAVLASGKEPGGKSHEAFWAMLLALGVPPQTCLLNSGGITVDFPIQSDIRVRPYARTYRVVAMLASYDVVGVEGTHAVTGIVDPATGKHMIFNPWGVMYRDASWRFPRDILELSAPGYKTLRNTPRQMANTIVQVLLAHDFIEQHDRPVNMQPVCLRDVLGRTQIDKTGVPTHDTAAVAPWRNIAAKWLVPFQYGMGPPRVLPEFERQSCEPLGTCTFTSHGFPTTVPAYTFTGDASKAPALALRAA